MFRIPLLAEIPAFWVQYFFLDFPHLSGHALAHQVSLSMGTTLSHVTRLGRTGSVEMSTAFFFFLEMNLRSRLVSAHGTDSWSYCPFFLRGEKEGGEEAN